MRRLRPRPLPTFAVVVCAAILLGLCGWQVSRHVEKNAGVPASRAAVGQPTLGEDALTEDPPPLYRHVQLAGRFLEPVVLEGGRQAGGRPAYGVVQRFETVGGRLVVVDRGEILAADREGALTRLPAALSVQGQLRPAPRARGRGPVNVGGTPEIWRRRSLGSILATLSGAPAGVYVRAGLPLADGARPVPAHDLADGYRPVVVSHNSLHYAFQWAAIAAVLVGLWAWASLEKP